MNIDIRVEFDKRAEKVLKSLSEIEQAHISGYIDLFKKNGFSIPGQYLKKLENNLWELRPGKLRVLFGMVRQVAMIVNIFKKKTRKTPLREIETAGRRLKEYQL